MSAKTTDAEVGNAYTAASVFLCFEFTETCYHKVLACANNENDWIHAIRQNSGAGCA